MMIVTLSDITVWKRDSSAISNVFSDTRCGLTAVIETFASVDKIVSSLLTSLAEQKPTVSEKNTLVSVS